MTIPLQFASLYDRQEVFVWCNCLLDLGTDFLVGNMVFNGSIGDWFRTTVGVRKGCLLSPTLFNIFLERIMTDASEDHEGTVSIGGRTITNLHFADDIDCIA